MASQLIYTSAPRLLQAGRTGFGTVAKHPTIPEWLQSELERLSQFSRLPSLDANRVVFSHSTYGQDDRKFHVLTRIRDAGADYTGRTNHIAHHFIFDTHDIRIARRMGISPVDVLAYLNEAELWRSSWNEEPRLLGNEDDLRLDSIQARFSLPATHFWALLPGLLPDYAALLAPGKNAEACWLIYPPGWEESILYALAESLLLHPNPWGFTFTNDLQPTDDEQLFAWRCLSPDSPLRDKALASVRPCFDLNSPTTLGSRLNEIPEKYLIQARTGKLPLPTPIAPASKTTLITAPAPQGPPSRPTPPPHRSLASRPPKPPQSPQHSYHYASPLTPPPRQSRLPLILTFSALALCLIIGGVYFLKQTEKNESGKIRTSIEERFSKSSSQNSKNLSNLLNGLSLSELQTCNSTLSEELANAIREENIGQANQLAKSISNLSINENTRNSINQYFNKIVDAIPTPTPSPTPKNQQTKITEPNLDSTPEPTPKPSPTPSPEVAPSPTPTLTLPEIATKVVCYLPQDSKGTNYEFPPQWKPDSSDKFENLDVNLGTIFARSSELQSGAKFNENVAFDKVTRIIKNTQNVIVISKKKLETMLSNSTVYFDKENKTFTNDFKEFLGKLCTIDDKPMEIHWTLNASVAGEIEEGRTVDLSGKIESFCAKCKEQLKSSIDNSTTEKTQSQDKFKKTYLVDLDLDSSKDNWKNVEDKIRKYNQDKKTKLEEFRKTNKINANSLEEVESEIKKSISAKESQISNSQNNKPKKQKETNTKNNDLKTEINVLKGFKKVDYEPIDYSEKSRIKKDFNEYESIRKKVEDLKKEDQRGLEITLTTVIKQSAKTDIYFEKKNTMKIPFGQNQIP